jgi:uncharacterized OsmC-like protein
MLLTAGLGACTTSDVRLTLYKMYGMSRNAVETTTKFTTNSSAR